MSAAETTPGFSLKESTPIKMPIALLLALLGMVISATVYTVNISRKQDALELRLAEAERVNFAQDRRFENIERVQSEFAVVKNNVEWLARLERGEKK